MKKVSKEKSINPIAWVPTAYFAMGLPFIAVNLVSTFMFKDLGISDTQIAFWTSVIMLRHSVTEWVIIRYSSSLIELRLFFRDQYLHDGSHRFEWSHA